MTARRVQPLLALVGLLAALALATACAPGASGSVASGEAADAGPPKGVAPPADSPLAQVQQGMAPQQVVEILGEPGQRHNYMTGKSWIPFYYGADAIRQEWKYKGLGRVVFSQGSFTPWRVTRIDYDPDERGY
jgi:hypothetical protein